jgi:hypothetical protein
VVSICSCRLLKPIPRFSSSVSEEKDLLNLFLLEMEVVGSDGEVVGKVKQVRATTFLVSRSLRRDIHDIYVPYNAVHDLTLDEVALTIPAYEVSQREKRTRPGMEAASQDWEVPPLTPPLLRRHE